MNYRASENRKPLDSLIYVDDKCNTAKFEIDFSTSDWRKVKAALVRISKVSWYWVTIKHAKKQPDEWRDLLEKLKRKVSFIKLYVFWEKESIGETVPIDYWFDSFINMVKGGLETYLFLERFSLTDKQFYDIISEGFKCKQIVFSNWDVKLYEKVSELPQKGYQVNWFNFWDSKIYYADQEKNSPDAFQDLLREISRTKLAESLNRMYVDIHYVNHDIKMDEETEEKLKNVMISTGMYDKDEIELHNHAKPFRGKLSEEWVRQLITYTNLNNPKYRYGNDYDLSWEAVKSYKNNTGFVSASRLVTQWGFFTKALQESRNFRLFRLTDSVLKIFGETYWKLEDRYYIQCLDLRGTQIIDMKQLMFEDTSKTYIFDGAQILTKWIINSGMYWSLKHILISTELKDSLRKSLRDANLHQIVVTDTVNPLEQLHYLRIPHKTDIDYQKALNIVYEAKKHGRSRVTFDNLYLIPAELINVLQKCSGLEEIVFNGCHFVFNFKIIPDESLVNTKSIRYHSCRLEYIDYEEAQSTESGVDKITSDRAKFDEYLKKFGYRSA